METLSRRWPRRRRQAPRDAVVPPTKTLVLTWKPDQNTSELARALEAGLFVPTPGRSSFPAPLRYSIQALQTAAVMLHKRPRVVIYQDPPFVTGALLVLLRPLLRFRICASAHSGPYNDPRWTRFRRFSRWVFSHCAGMFVHNEYMLGWACTFGIPALVLRYPGFALAAGTQFRRESPENHILVPLGYEPDEPIRELLEAARAAPHIKLLLTGKAPKWVVDAAPSNCYFTGWLDRADYEQLLATSRGVIALTLLEDTAQMAAFEAVEHGVPLLTSGTKALRHFHQEGAIFVTNCEPSTLAYGLESLWEQHAALRIGAEKTRETAIRESVEQLGRLRQMLGLAPQQ